MKKIFLFFLMGSFITCLLFALPPGTCTAYAECSNGGSISCSGGYHCCSGPGYVTCGTVTKKCS